MGDKQAQIKVNKCWGAWKSQAICQSAAMKCALSQVPACSQFIITIIIQDICLHTRAISHGVHSLKRIYCALNKCSRWTIYNNTELHAKRLSSSADPIICPAELLPVWIFRGTTHSVSVLMASICGCKNIQTFCTLIALLSQRQWRRKWNVCSETQRKQ